LRYAEGDVRSAAWKCCRNDSALPNPAACAIMVVHDACATRDLEFGGTTVPAEQVHAASMAALAFGYAVLPATEAYLAG
jgi:hypothetical protein